MKYVCRMYICLTLVTLHVIFSLVSIGTCPPGWRIHKGNCYQFNSNLQLTYTDAKHICEAQGTFLVSIFSGEENDYIVSQFEDLVNIGINDIWIGIAG